MFHFQKDSSKKPFHSSGYAEVAHGESIGSTSSQSFEARSAIDNNRQTVGKYHDSSIAHNLKGRALGRNVGRNPALGNRYVAPAERRRQFGSQAAEPSTPRERFSEPTGRGFNPFA